MITKLSSKGQITLPRRVRQALDVKPGDRILLVLDDKSVMLRPLGPCNARALAGSLGRYASHRNVGGQSRNVVKKEVARAAAQEA